MMHQPTTLRLAILAIFCTHQTTLCFAEETQQKVMGTVLITAEQPSSLPAFIPTTVEGISAKQLEKTINALDSEDALKYLPSLVVRKRYIGDYNHAVLSSRASGTGNSARSAVYADGILLSNYLGNGATYTPRWGLVTPEEIERVDVMYGPFSAAYRGNSVGAIVDYVTRMPKKFEAHAKFSYFTQPYDLYQTKERYHGKQVSTSLGNKHGDWSWWINLHRTDSEGQPMVFATRTLSQTPPAANAVAVTGAVAGLNRNNAPWWIIGSSTAYHTVQDHAKVKLAYQISPSTRLSYTMGLWQNEAQGNSATYLRDSNTQMPVYAGNISIAGKGYTLAASDFGSSRDSLRHVMHGLSLKTNSKSTWDWELAASQYTYQKDRQRSARTSQPTNKMGGAGSLQSQDGTAWNALAAKALWRPQGMQGRHMLEFGVQQENFTLQIVKQNLANNWRQDEGGVLDTEVGGKVRNTAFYAQDRWQLASNWQAVLGMRWENWRAENGYTRFNATKKSTYASRQSSFWSPKAALAYQWQADTIIKASIGRAVRTPTVAELYGATSNSNSQYINDPNLSPEKSWTSELSLEKDFGNSNLRLTLFRENVRDSLYSQTIFDSKANANISRVQNIARILTNGVEIAYNGKDVWKKGLAVSANATYADSRIKENAGFVEVPGDTLNKYQPRVPVWRASAIVSYQFTPQASAALGMRYSGKQFTTLNNSDINGSAYQGGSKYFTTDLRLRYQVNQQWSASFGIDNVNNYQYWNFHPYPQRTYVAELKYDYK